MSLKQQRLRAFERQIVRLAGRITRLKTISDTFSTLRLAVFLIGYGAVVAIAASGRQLPTLIAFAAVSAVFTLILVAHARVRHRLVGYEIWQDLAKDSIARMTLDWESIPISRLAVAQPNALELDIDLRDLHRLLDVTSSDDGRALLRTWLIDPQPDIKTAEQRQKLVGQLAAMPIFRKKLALAAKRVEREQAFIWRGSAVLRWLNQDTGQFPTPLLVILIGLSLINLLLFLPFAYGPVPPLFAIPWAIYILLYASQALSLRGLFEESLRLVSGLRTFSAVFKQIESQNYGDKSAVADLCSPIVADKPSRQMASLAWVVGLAALVRNPLAWGIVNAILPWDALIAKRLAHHRNDLREVMPVWLAIWTQLDTLSAFANFAYLNPAYVFPQFETDSQSMLEGLSLGHPLIDESGRVCNDFSLSSIGETVILTGSNMAGKSSFLRTVAINMTLAYVGSVVIAGQMRLAPMRLFTCIRVTDSLNDGISYFYAEVKRLKALLDAAQMENAAPLFFLIDEIFRGTNNRERLQGSQAFIRALSQSNALGLVATHDLELVHLAEENPHIKNFHFRESIENGRMVFDYQLRQGASPTTNALKIMVLEGLPIDETPESDKVIST